MSITKTCPCNIQRCIQLKKKIEKFYQKNFAIFNIFAKNMDRGYTLVPPRRERAEAVLTSTHNLCFGTKIRKIGIYRCISQFC